MISVILKRWFCTTSPPVLMMSSRSKEARLVGGPFVILIIILSSLHCHHHHHPPSHLYTNVSILMFPMIKKASFSIPKLCQANPRQRAVPTPFFLPVIVTTIIFNKDRLAHHYGYKDHFVLDGNHAHDLLATILDRRTIEVQSFASIHI